MSEMTFSVVSQNGSRRVGVADLLDRLADDLVVVELGVGRDLAGEDHVVALDQRLARDAALRVLLEAGVEDRVGDVIADLVGVTFGHRLGRERETRHDAPQKQKKPADCVAGPGSRLR